LQPRPFLSPGPPPPPPSLQHQRPQPPKRKQLRRAARHSGRIGPGSECWPWRPKRRLISRLCMDLLSRLYMALPARCRRSGTGYTRAPHARLPGRLLRQLEEQRRLLLLLLQVLLLLVWVHHPRPRRRQLPVPGWLQARHVQTCTASYRLSSPCSRPRCPPAPTAPPSPGPSAARRALPGAALPEVALPRAGTACRCGPATPQAEPWCRALSSIVFPATAPTRGAPRTRPFCRRCAAPRGIVSPAPACAGQARQATALPLEALQGTALPKVDGHRRTGDKRPPCRATARGDKRPPCRATARGEPCRAGGVSSSSSSRGSGLVCRAGCPIAGR
jgi:hypothetical protein